MHHQWHHYLELSALAALKPIFAIVGMGARLFDSCKASHTGVDGGKDKLSKHICGVFECAKASDRDFCYFPALKDRGKHFSYTNLEVLLVNPKGIVPRTKMAFAQLEKPNQRADILAYLRSVCDPPKALP